VFALELLLVLTASGPLAELPPAACVFAAGGDTVARGISGRVEVELSKALKKKGIALVDLEALFPPPAPESSEEGDRLFAKGREAYDNLDFDTSAQLLTQAAVFFIKRPAAAKPEQLSEIFLFLGASELQNGAKAQAQKEFTRALQMNPGLEPDAKYFGGDVQSAFNAAQNEMGSRAKGKLVVDSVPSGALVEAFGLSYGLTPLSDIELPAGRYLVQIKRPGFAATAAFPEVVAKQTVEVSQKLQAAPGLSAARAAAEELLGKSDRDPADALQLGRAMNARYLVLATVSSASAAKNNLELELWNLQTLDRVRGVKFTVDSNGGGYENGADAVLSFVNRPSRVVSAEEVPAPPPAGGSILKKWWFWTAIGTIAAVGVTTAVVASQPHGPGGFNTVLGQP
jgi:hypothetical protein